MWGVILHDVWNRKKPTRLIISLFSYLLLKSTYNLEIKKKLYQCRCLRTISVFRDKVNNNSSVYKNMAVTGTVFWLLSARLVNSRRINDQFAFVCTASDPSKSYLQCTDTTLLFHRCCEAVNSLGAREPFWWFTRNITQTGYLSRSTYQ